MSDSKPAAAPVPITEGDRNYHWPAPAARPKDHPGLSDLGL
jgi:nuclear transport factor 2 (NTF2) superfamily protein